MATGVKLCVIGMLLGTLGVTLGRGAAAQGAAEVSANEVDGAWHYRSFFNDAKPTKDIGNLLFGEGDVVLRESPIGTLTGTGDFGGGNTMAFHGTVSRGTWLAVRFQGIGTGANNKDWKYDYVGVLMPRWPNGTDQQSVLVGSVVRSAPHANQPNGTAPAGRVASFIAIKG